VAPLRNVTVGAGSCDEEAKLFGPEPEPEPEPERGTKGGAAAAAARSETVDDAREAPPGTKSGASADAEVKLPLAAGRRL